MPSSPPAGPLPPIPPELFEINNGPKLMWILSVMSVVVTIVVGLRVFVRLSRRIRLGIDDWLIIVALVRYHPVRLSLQGYRALEGLEC